MAIVQSYLVKPREPTVLAGQSHHVLRNLDLMLGFKIDLAFVVPGPIDTDTFNDALAGTLAVYPIYAGRVQRPRDSETTRSWRIRLTNSAIPVSVVHSDEEHVVPSNGVVQNPWTLSDPVSVPKQWDYDSDEPLFRVTIKRFVKIGYTSIGVSGSHVLGDGFVYLRFMRLLSQLYQGLPPEDEPPCYSAPAEAHFKADDWGRIPMPDLESTYNVHETPPFLKPGLVKPQKIVVHFTRDQVLRIQRYVSALAPPEDKDLRISKQDALFAFLVHGMDQADPDCYAQRMSVVLMGRGIGSIAPTQMTNCLPWAVTDDAGDRNSDSIYSIARRVRKAIIRLRNPEYAAAWDAAHDPVALDVANSDRAANFVQPPGNWVLNSTWRFNWTSAHFGYEGQTRFFHTQLDEPRFVKMFTPNPVEGPDGTWQVPAEVEVSFFLHTQAAERFKTILADEMSRIGLPEGATWV